MPSGMIWIPAFRFPAIVVLLIAAPYAALAEQPETVTRYFALAVSSENPAPPPDLLADGSKLLVVHDNSTGGRLDFCNFDPSHPLAATQWFRAQTTHVTDHGVENYNLFWLAESPPNGAIGLTGPVGEAGFIDTYLVRKANGSECGGSTTKWVVVDEPSASTVVWYIGVGVFSK